MNTTRLRVFQKLAMETLKEHVMISARFFAFSLFTSAEMSITISEAREVLESLRKKGKLETDETGRFYGKASAR